MEAYSVNEQSFSQDLRRYLALLWRWAWLLALATIVSGSTAFAISRRTTPVYRATTTLLINEAPSDRINEYTALLTSERLARTYSELLTKGPVLGGVIAILDLDMDEEDLHEDIDVQLVRDTQLIEVSVESTNPVLAASIANTLAAVFSQQNEDLQAARYVDSKANLEAQLAAIDANIEETAGALAALEEGTGSQGERDRLENTLARYQETYAGLLQSYEEVRVAEAQATSNVVQVEPAIPPELPVRPRTLLNTLLASVVGVMVATGVVFLIEALDDTLRDPEEAQRQLGLPILGMIARVDNSTQTPIAAAEPRSPVSEAFRSLRTNIQYASVDRPLTSLLVTSPSPTDGKTTVAANLGVVLAQSGRRVALLDADLRRPRLHNLLNLPNRGLSQLFVQKQINLDGMLRPTSVPLLAALPAGGLPPNPAELIGSEKMTEIVKALQAVTDVVVIDSPPVMVVTDAAVLASRVDGVLLVIKPGVTKIAACRRAVEQLRMSGANLLGVVFNAVDLRRSVYSHYYSGYYHEYLQDDGRVARRQGRKTGPRRVRPQEHRVEEI